MVAHDQNTSLFIVVPVKDEMQYRENLVLRLSPHTKCQVVHALSGSSRQLLSLWQRNHIMLWTYKNITRRFFVRKSRTHKFCHAIIFECVAARKCVIVMQSIAFDFILHTIVQPLKARRSARSPFLHISLRPNQSLSNGTNSV